MRRFIPGLFLFGLLGAVVACMPMKPTPTGDEDFAAYCASCHGVEGKGDGAVVATLAKRPADLTQLSAKNGGKFPMTRVMSKIYGYADPTAAEMMPGFGDLLEGETVLFDSGDGIATPTPLRLVQLAQHVQGLN